MRAVREAQARQRAASRNRPPLQRIRRFEWVFQQPLGGPARARPESCPQRYPAPTLLRPHFATPGRLARAAPRDPRAIRGRTLSRRVIQLLDLPPPFGGHRDRPVEGSLILEHYSP